MKVLRINNITNEKKYIEYPRWDMGPLIGNDGTYSYYEPIENPIPKYDSRIYKINKVETLIDGGHLGRLDITYELEQLSNKEIISNLNNSVGEYLDSNYPEWERSKHAGESLRFLLKGQNNWNSSDLLRISYIESTANWARNCRQLRDEYEYNLINNNILPDFNWPVRPINPFK